MSCIAFTPDQKAVVSKTRAMPIVPGPPPIPGGGGSVSTDCAGAGAGLTMTQATTAAVAGAAGRWIGTALCLHAPARIASGKRRRGEWREIK